MLPFQIIRWILLILVAVTAYFGESVARKDDDGPLTVKDLISGEGLSLAESQQVSFVVNHDLLPAEGKNTAH